MRLSVSDIAPEIKIVNDKLLVNVDGESLELGGDSKKYTLLSFFRDTNCPFCNVRIFQLTQRHKQLNSAGLEVIAFFVSSHEDVAQFVAARPRPFRVIADPENIAYTSYGIKRSFPRKVYGVFRRLCMWVFGMRLLGVKGTIRGAGGLNTNNIMPADFILDEQGKVIDVYYGDDPGDHIPFERIEQILSNK